MSLASSHALLQRLLALGGGLAVGLLVAEGAFRVLGIGAAVEPVEVGIEWRPDSPFVEAEDAGVRYQLRPGFEGSMAHVDADGNTLREVTVRTDGDGLRVGAGQEGETEPGAALVVGDSITFAQGVEAEDGFVAVADRLLPEVRLRNAAVPGWNLEQEVSWLHREAHRFSPAAIVVAFYTNDLDVVNPHVPSAVIPPRRPARWGFGEQGLRRYSRVVNKLFRAIEHGDLLAERARRAPQGGPPRDRQASARSFGRLADICERLGSRCMVVLLPPFDRPNTAQLQAELAEVAGTAEAAGLSVLRLEGVLADIPLAERVLYAADPHPSERAHARLGEELARGLSAMGSFD